MKKFLAIFLVSVLLLSVLAACTNTPTDTDTNGGDTPSETNDPNEGKVVLFEKGKESTYTLFFTDDASTVLQNSANALAYRLSNAYDLDLYAFKEKTADGRATEIYVGNAKVAEAQTAIGLLKGAENEYLIKYFENGRLVFVGSNDKSIIQAVNDFIGTYVTDNKLLLDADFEVYKNLGDSKRGEWKLTGIPEYTAGKLASNIYNIGYGIAGTNTAGRMHTISDTTEEEFDAYVETLKSSGFTVDSTNEFNGNKSVELLDSKKKVVYVYFIKSRGEARVITDSNSRPISEFSYSYTPKTGEFSGIYQFGIMYDPIAGGNGQGSEGKYPNCGAFHIIKLADNSVILMDGGTPGSQATEKSSAALMDFLYQITGTKEGEKIKVACWYLSHAHGDHYGFMKYLVNDYSDQLEIERVMHNLTMGQMPAELQTTFKNIIAKYPNVKYLKPYTGQKLQLGDVGIDVILTHDTLTDPITNAGYTTDYNETSDMIKFTINGKTFMYFGDWGGNWTMLSNPADMENYTRIENTLFDVYRAEDGSYPMLKSDIIQIAHHAINDWLDNVHRAVHPEYAFIPQIDVEMNKYQGSCFRNIILELRALNVPDDQMYHGGRFTHWLEIAQDGTITHKYQKLTGADEGYYYYVDANGNVLYEDEDGKINTEKKGTMIKDADGKATFEGMTDIKAVYEKGYWDYINVHKPFSSFSTEEA